MDTEETIIKKLIIDAPLHIVQPRKTMKDRKVGINLNIYRNLHHRVSNDVKRQYKDEIKNILYDTGQSKIKFKGQVIIDFTLYKGSRRKTDKSNFFAIQAKFLYDALVDLGVLVEDNDNIILTETLHPTIIDKENPRAEFIIREVV